MRGLAVLLLVYGCSADGNNSGDVMEESGDREMYESSEKIGPVVTQVNRHPYSVSILKNGTYECSAVILNTYWLLALSKCFDTEFISSYLSHKNMNNYTVRAGSSYNMKGGSLYKMSTLINNFDLKVSAVKLQAPLVFSSSVQAVRLPDPNEEVILGYLASILAWTPDGHMRVVNVPVIDATICEENTKLLPGHYICVSGVQDPNRNFCRKDNGGAVIQNNTLIGIASFYQSCALYTRAHAFPKVSSFSHWLDNIIWDEDNRPTTVAPTTRTTKAAVEVTDTDTDTAPTSSIPFFVDPSKFMLTLPYDPINLPLEPAEDNSVLPRISLYESYLQNMARAKTSTTPDPNAAIERARLQWLKKYGKAVMMMPADMYMPKKYNQFDY